MPIVFLLNLGGPTNHLSRKNANSTCTCVLRSVAQRFSAGDHPRHLFDRFKAGSALAFPFRVGFWDEGGRSIRGAFRRHGDVAFRASWRLGRARTGGFHGEVLARRDEVRLEGREKETHGGEGKCGAVG